jgi:hypothetical protein
MPAAIDIIGILADGTNPSPALPQNTRRTIGLQRSTDMLIRMTVLYPNGAPVDLTNVIVMFTMKLVPEQPPLISRLGLPPSIPAPTNRVDFTLAPIDTIYLPAGRYTWDVRAKFGQKWETLVGLSVFLIEPNDGDPDQPLTVVSPVVFYVCNPPLIANQSFDEGIFSILEIGNSSINPSASVVYNRPPDSAQVVDGLHVPLDLVTPFTNWQEPFVYTQTIINAEQDFILTALKAGEPPATSTLSLFWQPLVYWGSAPIPGVYDASFITGLSDSKLLPSQVYSPGYSAGPTEHLYYAVPSVYEAQPGNFIDTQTGIVAGMHLAESGVSVLNAFSVLIPYDIWESDVAGLGPITLSVTGG